MEVEAQQLWDTWRRLNYRASSSRLIAMGKY
jgi:hypothetical protein